MEKEEQKQQKPESSQNNPNMPKHGYDALGFSKLINKYIDKRKLASLQEVEELGIKYIVYWKQIRGLNLKKKDNNILNQQSQAQQNNKINPHLLASLVNDYKKNGLQASEEEIRNLGIDYEIYLDAIFNIPPKIEQEFNSKKTFPVLVRDPELVQVLIKGEQQQQQQIEEELNNLNQNLQESQYQQQQQQIKQEFNDSNPIQQQNSQNKSNAQNQRETDIQKKKSQDRMKKRIEEENTYLQKLCAEELFYKFIATYGINTSEDHMNYWINNSPNEIEKFLNETIKIKKHVSLKIDENNIRNNSIQMFKEKYRNLLLEIEKLKKKPEDLKKENIDEDLNGFLKLLDKLKNWNYDDMIERGLITSLSKDIFQSKIKIIDNILELSIPNYVNTPANKKTDNETNSEKITSLNILLAKLKNIYIKLGGNIDLRPGIEKILIILKNEFRKKK
ncbi:MAG: hypothetical protein N4A49_09195 [Marinifilaceae bacterium]|jgi:hypothetical protein|nr:hypothetical protein [Marinifilaceae bacterium]